MFTIRPYQPADIEAVYQVFYHAVHQVACKDYTPEQLAVWGKPQRNTIRWDEGLLKQTVWVAELNGELVGFTSLHGDSGYLDFLYVHHLHQGKGIAKALFQSLLGEAVRIALPQLTTDSSLTAKPFFLSQGFVLVEENVKTVDDVPFLNSRMMRIL